MVLNILFPEWWTELGTLFKQLCYVARMKFMRGLILAKSFLTIPIILDYYNRKMFTLASPPSWLKTQRKMKEGEILTVDQYEYICVG